MLPRVSLHFMMQASWYMFPSHSLMHDSSPFQAPAGSVEPVVSSCPEAGGSTDVVTFLGPQRAVHLASDMP